MIALSETKKNKTMIKDMDIFRKKLCEIKPTGKNMVIFKNC
jgi:hypothetical protein